MDEVINLSQLFCPLGVSVGPRPPDMHTRDRPDLWPPIRAHYDSSTRHGKGIDVRKGISVKSGRPSIHLNA